MIEDTLKELARKEINVVENSVGPLVNLLETNRHTFILYCHTNVRYKIYKFPIPLAIAVVAMQAYAE